MCSNVRIPLSLGLKRKFSQKCKNENFCFNPTVVRGEIQLIQESVNKN
jgi:hypothetical protein